MTACIDAHQHTWRLDRGDYDWLTPDITALYRDFRLDDYAPLKNALGIDQSILVQAAPTEAETLYLLSVAEVNSDVLGVVGWVDLQDETGPSAIGRLGAHTKLLGIRPMLQDMEDLDWLLQPRMKQVVRCLIDNGLCFDALMRPAQLSTLIEFAWAHPELSIILDHAGKPDIASRDYTKWRADIEALSALSNVSCKFSGLVTEASPRWQTSDLETVFETLCATFGPNRLLWGSDWPMVCVAGGLPLWWEAAKELCADLPSKHRDAIFGGNALRLYARTTG